MHPFDEALNPVFLDRWCVVCSSHGELYCYAGGFVTLCHVCTRLIELRHARYPSGPTGKGIPAHCVACHEARRR
jgi:hypothetical protein